MTSTNDIQKDQAGRMKKGDKYSIGEKEKENLNKGKKL